jgi:hypothetical protein
MNTKQKTCQGNIVVIILIILALTLFALTFVVIKLRRLSSEFTYAKNYPFKCPTVATSSLAPGKFEALKSYPSPDGAYIATVMKYDGAEKCDIVVHSSEGSIQDLTPLYNKIACTYVTGWFITDTYFGWNNDRSLIIEYEKGKLVKFSPFDGGKEREVEYTYDFGQGTLASVSAGHYVLQKNSNGKLSYAFYILADNKLVGDLDVTDLEATNVFYDNVNKGFLIYGNLGDKSTTDGSDMVQSVFKYYSLTKMEYNTLYTSPKISAAQIDCRPQTIVAYPGYILFKGGACYPIPQGSLSKEGFFRINL